MLIERKFRLKAILVLLLVMLVSMSFAFTNIKANASNAAIEHKNEVTQNGQCILASSDTASNLVSSNLTHINSVTGSTQTYSATIYDKSDVDGSANSTVWGISFHSALATKISNAIQFTTPIDVSTIESFTIRMQVHFSSTQGAYHTDMGGVMLAKLSETDCRKNSYSHTISRSVAQDQWIDYRISGEEMAKFVEDDGTIKGIQIASDTRGANSSMFYEGTPNQRNTWLYIDYIYYTAKTKTAVDSLRENGFLLASANAGDYEFVDGSLKAFAGYTQVSGTGGKSTPSVSVVGGKNSYDEGDTTFDWDGFNDGMIGTSAFRVPIHSDATSLYTTAIKFSQKVKASEIGGITIRMYARLSNSDTYQTTYGGIQLFGLTSEGYTKGYMIPEDIKQNEWVEIVLLPEEAAVLADADGYISGLQFGAAFHSTHADFLYQGTPSQGKTQQTARIWIEYVSVAKKVDIVYKSDGAEIQRNSAFVGTSINDAFVPTKANNVFCGWYKENGDLYDFSGVIDEQTILTAKWETAKDISTAKGLYMKEDQGNYAKTNTYLYIDENGQIDFSDISTVDPTSYGLTVNDEIYIINKDFSVTKYKLGTTFVKVADNEIITINYDYEIGSKTIRVKSGDQLKMLSLERAGYLLAGYTDAQGNAVDFSNLTVSSNINLVAVWEYDQVSATLYNFYHADYYCKETGAILSLKADNKATLNNQTAKNGEFYILKPGVIVLIFDGVKTENTVYAQRIVTIDNQTYVRLGDYIVTFDTVGGSKIEDYTVSGGDHKVVKPEDPTREGYNFKGWVTIDGEEFDFNQIITSSTTLYAVWESVETDQLPANNNKLIIWLIVGIGVVVVAAAVVVFLIMKKKKSTNKPSDDSNKTVDENSGDIE